MNTKVILFILFLISNIASFGQINFESGYFIDNSNIKTDCLIKNEDWKNNPTEFIYKLTNNDSEIYRTIASVKEFGIYGISRFIRYSAEIDRSTDYTRSLTNSRKSKWSREQVFLKILVQGMATLYFFEDGDLRRYFYSVNDSLIEQLVYKRYFTENGTIAVNNEFRQQLWVRVKCPNANIGSVQNINYKQKELIQYFKNYNKCNGDTVEVYKKEVHRDYLNISILPGITSSSLRFSNYISNSDVVFSNVIGFSLGLDAEFILPYKSNKWGILIEPTLQYLNTEKKSTSHVSKIKYNVIELPVGLRYYCFLNKNTKLFFDGIYVTSFGYNINSSIIIENSNLDLSPGSNLAFGAGINFKQFSLEARCITNRNLILYTYRSSENTRISLIFGYRFLNLKH